MSRYPDLKNSSCLKTTLKVRKRAFSRKMKKGIYFRALKSRKIYTFDESQCLIRANVVTVFGSVMLMKCG